MRKWDFLQVFKAVIVVNLYELGAAMFLHTPPFLFY